MGQGSSLTGKIRQMEGELAVEYSEVLVSVREINDKVDLAEIQHLLQIPANHHYQEKH